MTYAKNFKLTTVTILNIVLGIVQLNLIVRLHGTGRATAILMTVTGLTASASTILNSFALAAIVPAHLRNREALTSRLSILTSTSQLLALIFSIVAHLMFHRNLISVMVFFSVIIAGAISRSSAFHLSQKRLLLPSLATMTGLLISDFLLGLQVLNSYNLVEISLLACFTGLCCQALMLCVNTNDFRVTYPLKVDESFRLILFQLVAKSQPILERIISSILGINAISLIGIASRLASGFEMVSTGSISQISTGSHAEANSHKKLTFIANRDSTLAATLGGFLLGFFYTFGSEIIGFLFLGSQVSEKEINTLHMLILVYFIAVISNSLSSGLVSILYGNEEYSRVVKTASCGWVFSLGASLIGALYFQSLYMVVLGFTLGPFFNLITYSVIVYIRFKVNYFSNRSGAGLLLGIFVGGMIGWIAQWLSTYF